MLENSTTWMTTGATHAPASSAATAPMLKASAKLPLLDEVPRLPAYWEKSICSTSNIASARTKKRTAIPRLNQGDELIVPKVPAVRITTRPIAP